MSEYVEQIVVQTEAELREAHEAHEADQPDWIKALSKQRDDLIREECRRRGMVAVIKPGQPLVILKSDLPQEYESSTLSPVDSLKDNHPEHFRKNSLVCPTEWGPAVARDERLATQWYEFFTNKRYQHPDDKALPNWPM